MQPPSDDQMWISKEEYRRLQTAAGMSPQVAGSPSPVNGIASPASKPGSRRIKVIAAVCLAVLFYASLVAPFLSYAIVVIVPGFLLFAMHSVHKFIVMHTHILGENSKEVSLLSKSPYRMLFILLLLIVLTPAIFGIGMSILFITALASNGGQSS